MPAVHEHENESRPRPGDPGTTNGISVAVIDDRPVIGRGISTILDATAGIRLVDRLSEAAAAEKSPAYDVLVLGIHTSHVIELLRLIDVLAGRCRLVLFARWASP